jgi:hypothetical protein
MEQPVPTRGSYPSVDAAIKRFQQYIIARTARTAPGPSSARHLIQLVSEELAAVACPLLPVDPMSVASLLGISLAFASQDPSGQLGKLEPVLGGFRLALYGQRHISSPSEGNLELADERAPSITRRGRFTIAHEIGHSLFYSRAGEHERPSRVVPVAATSSGHWKEEGLCHDFARALLLPTSANSLAESQPSIQGLLAGAGAFRVSKDVFVRRILYDWEMWPDAEVVTVRVGPDRSTLMVHRGADARRAAKRQSRLTPVRSQILGLRSKSAIADLLRKTLAPRRVEIWTRGIEVWAVASQ